MDRHFDEYVSMSDRAHREAMERGSDMLLRAIRDARMGVCPATPVWPVKLPMDYSNATGPKADDRKRDGVPQGGIDHVEQLMARKMKAGEIAEELGVNVQKATWMMAGVRKRRGPSDFDRRLREPLWG